MTLKSIHPFTKGIYYLLPPTDARLGAVRDVMGGNPCPERYLFYGLDYLTREGLDVKDNIRDYHPPTFLTLRALQIYRLIIKAIGTYGGALEWVLPHMRSCASARLLFVYSDRLMFPLINMRLTGLLPRIPTVYVAMGLPEKFEQFRNKSRLLLYLAEFSRLEKIISLSKTQSDTLRSNYGLMNVEFICDGVDTSYFKPIATVHDVDVLSIGADPFRDFVTLLDVAAKLSLFSFRIITSRPIAATLADSPSNVEILIDRPMGEIRDYMARCRLLALPVRDNTYSGATTVLLQAMSMGKAVVANSVGANKEGYPFIDGVNCLMVRPGEPGALVSAVRSLMENAEQRKAIGEEARRTSFRELDINGFHERLFSVMRNVLSASS
jgi:glycosyltransferase involved in cell wall biosynthesis